MSRSEIKFRYFLSKNDMKVVIFFSGVLDHSLRQQLQEYNDSIQTYLDAEAVILDFSEIGDVNAAAYRTLIELQNIVRNRGIELRICGLPEKIQRRLIAKDVVQDVNIASDLKAALFPKCLDFDPLMDSEAFLFESVVKAA